MFAHHRSLKIGMKFIFLCANQKFSTVIYLSPKRCYLLYTFDSFQFSNCSGINNLLTYKFRCMIYLSTKALFYFQLWGDRVHSNKLINFVTIFSNCHSFLINFVIIVVMGSLESDSRPTV